MKEAANYIFQNTFENCFFVVNDMKEVIEKEICQIMNITEFDIPMLLYFDTENQV